MNRRPSLSHLPFAALLCGVAVLFLDMTLTSGGSAVPLISFSVLMCAVFLLAALSLEKKKEFEAVFRRAFLPAILAIVGALALAAGCVLSFPAGGMFRKILAMLGILAAAGLIGAQVLLLRGKKPQVFFLIFAVLFYVVKLFTDFRNWMVDPTVLDYCFLLFAMISFMIATYQAGAFCFDKGSRRQLAFFCLTGLLFGTVAICAGSRPEMLVYGGSILWMLSCGLQALR